MDPEQLDHLQLAAALERRCLQYRILRLSPRRPRHALPRERGLRGAHLAHVDPRRQHRYAPRRRQHDVEPERLGPLRPRWPRRVVPHQHPGARRPLRERQGQHVRRSHRGLRATRRVPPALGRRGCGVRVRLDPRRRALERARRHQLHVFSRRALAVARSRCEPIDRCLCEPYRRAQLAAGAQRRSPHRADERHAGDLVQPPRVVQRLRRRAELPADVHRRR